MASGHCDFCGIWHSAGCCHPGKARLDALEAERDEARSDVAKAKAHSTKLDASLRQCRERLKQVAKPAYEIRREALLEAADWFQHRADNAVAFGRTAVAGQLRRMAEEAPDG